MHQRLLAILHAFVFNLTPPLNLSPDQIINQSNKLLKLFLIVRKAFQEKMGMNNWGVYTTVYYSAL